MYEKCDDTHAKGMTDVQSYTSLNTASRGSLKICQKRNLFIWILILVWIQLRGIYGLSDSIGTGFNVSYMSFVDTNGIFLESPGKVFALTFMNYARSSNFYLSIMHMDSEVVTWTANRDTPVSMSDTLVFSHDGNLVLHYGNGNSIAWSTDTGGLGVKTMQVQDSGNLVLLDDKNLTIWQSFDYPTDTLLCGQILKPGSSLRSSVSSSNKSSGPYSLSLVSQDLLLIYTSNNLSQTYWSMMKDRRVVSIGGANVDHVALNSSVLSLSSNNSVSLYSLTWESDANVCRAYLQDDGNMAIFVYSANVWTQQIEAVEDDCMLPLRCGPNGICRSGQCSCPDSFQPLDANNITEGCSAPFMPQCKGGSNLTSNQLEEIGDGMDYFANSYAPSINVSSIDQCKKLCIQNCSCSSMFYYDESHSCFLYAQLLTIQGKGQSGHYLYFKTNISVNSSSYSHGIPSFLLPVIIASAMFVVLVLLTSFLYFFLKWKRKKVLKGKEVLPHDDEFADEEELFEYISGLPTRYTYKELQIATNSFSTKIGEGGFGTVFEGELPDGTRVAIKRLDGVGRGKKEFRAEVEIIARINHIHLVQLLGFCAEGSHRLLVYEFMSKGSLDKLLFNSDMQREALDWCTRNQIAIGTARGLAYLHDDCREKIIHCDIKPENILLDNNYNAKVSDFGLSKLLSKEQSLVFTNIRGTRGYLAPEWITNVGISEKTDVYSFGMVLLEIINGRKNCGPDDYYFPAYAVSQIEKGDLETLIDQNLLGVVPMESFVRVLRIALWCIQEEPSSRPSMVNVVHMLEGNMDIPEPPLSSLYWRRVHAGVLEVPEQWMSSFNLNRSLSAVQLSGAR